MGAWSCEKSIQAGAVKGRSVSCRKKAHELLEKLIDAKNELWFLHLHTRKDRKSMNSKTLLLLGVVGAVASSTAGAQVYSVNAVGYVNKTIPTGFSIVANPLIAADNKISTLFPSVPDGTIVYKFNTATAQFTANNYFFGWSDAAQELVPGEGAFVYNPGAPFTVTFVGDVSTGSLSTAVPAGFSLVGSKVPQSGALDSVLGFPVNDGDIVYRYDNAANQYVAHNYFFGWNIVPNIQVAEGFFAYNPGSAKTWTRNFSVN